MRTLSELEVAAVSGGDMTPLTDAEMRRVTVDLKARGFTRLPDWLTQPYQPIPTN